jgi:putative acetyltransferase
MKIRRAHIGDIDAIRDIHLSAFPPTENRVIADLASDLFPPKTTDEVYHLVFDEAGTLAGHVAFSPVRLRESPDTLGYIIAPLAVVPMQQRKGVGTSLVRVGIEAVSKAGAAVIFVYGDPNFYSKFGFKTDAALQFITPFPMKFPHGWQAIEVDSALRSFPCHIECVTALLHAELW